VNTSYDLSLTLLGLKPAEFWLLTPSETADLFVAYRKRENRRLIKEAWVLSLQVIDKAREGHEDELSPIALFKKMPGTFPDDMPGLKEDPTDSPERRRRRNLRRTERP